MMANAIRGKGKMVQTLDNIRDAVGDVATHSDILRAYLFGSYARGEAEDDSDVDICLETGATFSLFSAGSFAYELERALGVPVDVVSERSLFPSVRNAMLEDRVLLYERA